MPKEQHAMSMFAMFDATQVADRLVDDTDDTRWVLARPAAAAGPARPVVVPAPYSWWSLARNPNALLLTGMVTAALVRDAVRTSLA